MCNPKLGLLLREKQEFYLHEETQYLLVMTVLWLCLQLLKITVGQRILEYWLSLAVSLFLLHVGFEVVLDVLWMVRGGSGAGGNRERICAHHTSLSSYWQESACSSVGERTCIQREAEERRSERNGGRMVGGGKGEKKLMPARHPIWGRFWCWSQRDFIVPKTASSVCLCVCSCSRVMFVLYVFAQGG